MQANYCPHCGGPLQTSEIDGKARRCCSASGCSYIFWNNPVPVIAAIVELDDAIILARNKNWPEKMYGLITGFLEQGETPDTAVCREVQEELALEVVSVDFIGNYSFFEMNQLLLAYHVFASGRIVLGEELAEIKRVPIDRLKPWSIGTGPAVRDWLTRRTGA